MQRVAVRLPEAALARPGGAATELASPTAFLCLLVCLKDSTGLAVACTSSGLLSPMQFAEVRREAERDCRLSWRRWRDPRRRTSAWSWRSRNCRRY